MNNYEINKLRDKLSRLFVLGVHQKINLTSFAYFLCNSEFISKIEKRDFDTVIDEPIEKTFYKATGLEIKEDDSFGIYNDAYWAGQNYFDLHLKTGKSFEYIFLKMPIELMLNVYTIFHEMDFSSLLSYFEGKATEETILRALCKKRKCSLNNISKETNIPLATLKKYNSSDKSLYNANFQTISKIKNYFNVGFSLFIK